jgi:ketosteroid isomerase-like protein
MSESPVDIVQRLLSDPSNPDVVHELVAEDSTYVSLNFEDPDLKRIMPWCGTGHGSGALLQTFSDVSRYWSIKNFEILDIFGSDNRVAVFGTFTYTSSVLGQDVTSPFAVLAKVENGKIVYTQFMEDSFATARSFRSAGTWTIQSNPDGSVIEV